MIPNPFKKEAESRRVITVTTISLSLETDFVSLVYNPQIEGIKLELLMEYPIKMRSVSGSSTAPGQPMQIPPSMLAAKGVILYFQFEQDLKEWDESLEAKRKESESYTVQSQLKCCPPSLRPKAPRV